MLARSVNRAGAGSVRCGYAVGLHQLRCLRWKQLLPYSAPIVRMTLQHQLRCRHQPRCEDRKYGPSSASRSLTALMSPIILMNGLSVSADRNCNAARNVLDSTLDRYWTTTSVMSGSPELHLSGRESCANSAVSPLATN